MSRDDAAPDEAKLTPDLPRGLASAIEGALTEAGFPSHIVSVEPLGGGCVNHACRLVTDRGGTFFLKWNARAPSGMFDAEADGLRSLAAAGALHVPRVLAFGEAANRRPTVPAWLLLEYITPGRPGRDFAARLGEGLVAVHRSDRGGWGWRCDNFIGSLAQENARAPSWGAFWRDRRLAPQLADARARGHLVGGNGRLLDRILDRTEALLASVEDEGPSLLHGDLWGGNVYADEEGRPVLIDPAVHRGHREVDLAMSELFGGFPVGWPDAYAEAWPLDPEYDGFRRALYQLYYLLVHVNLFGASYQAGCMSAAQQVLGST